MISHIHCEVQNKLSKTMGVTIGVYGINNYFTVPYIVHIFYRAIYSAIKHRGAICCVIKTLHR